MRILHNTESCISFHQNHLTMIVKTTLTTNLTIEESFFKVKKIIITGRLTAYYDGILWCLTVLSTDNSIQDLYIIINSNIESTINNHLTEHIWTRMEYLQWSMISCLTGQRKTENILYTVFVHSRSLMNSRCQRLYFHVGDVIDETPCKIGQQFVLMETRSHVWVHRRQVHFQRTRTVQMQRKLH